MALAFTLGGSPQNIQPGWKISEYLNGRNIMEGSTISLDGTYRPAGRDVVNAVDGATTYFKGLVHDLDEQGLGGLGVTPIRVGFGATDYNVYADWKHIELTIPAGNNLKSGLTTIVAALSAYGVTLDGTQDNGTVFTEDFILDLAPVTEILNKLSVATGRAWDISYGKVLSMSAPGTLPSGAANNAPFNIAAGNGMAIGDIKVKPSLSNFANVIRVKYSSAATTAYAFFQMNANPLDTQTVTVGGKTYTFQTTLTDVDGNVQIDAGDYRITLTNFERAIKLTGNPGTDYAASMTVNSQVTAGVQNENSIRVVALQAGANGSTIACTETAANCSWRTEGGEAVTTLKFGVDESLSLWVRSPEADSALPAAADRVERIFEHAEIRDKNTAQLMADGYRVRHLQVPNEIYYRTLTTGLHPGMKQSIVEAKRDLNSANCLITSVQISAVGNVLWYDITAVDALVIPPDDLDIFHSGGSSGSGGGGTSGVSITTLTVGANGQVNSSGTTWTSGTGFVMEYNGGSPRLRVGSVAGNRFVYDENGVLTVVSQNLTIDANGVLITPDAAVRSEDSGYRFGAAFGVYGTLVSNTAILDVLAKEDSVIGIGRINLIAAATNPGPDVQASLVLEGSALSGSYAALTADAITFSGPLTLNTPVNGAVVYSTATALAYTAAGSSGQILRSAGAAAPIWSTATYPATVTANQILHATATNVVGGNTNFVFDGTNFGIGTPTPSRPLHVYKNASGADPLAKFQNAHASGYANVQIDRSATNRTSFIHHSTADTVDWYVGTAYNGGSANSAYTIGTGINLSDAKIAVLTTGLVGIGTSAPVYRLSVVGTSANALVIGQVVRQGSTVDSGSAIALGFSVNDVEMAKAAVIYERTAGYGLGKMHLALSSTGDNTTAVTLANAKMTILNTGQVGIGTTSPTTSALLVVRSTTEQLRLEYDASNYLSVTVGSTGGVTFNATGSGAAFTFSDAVTFSGAVTHSVAVTDAGATLRTGVISPTQITAATDNWNPTGLSTANVIRINVDAARNITGIVAQTSGTMLLLYNTTAFVITLKHDATSTAANRFYAPGAIDFPLAARGSAWIRYDGTHSRWTIIS